MSMHENCVLEKSSNKETKIESTDEKVWDLCDDVKSAKSKTRYFYDKSRRCACMKTAI